MTTIDVTAAPYNASGLNSTDATDAINAAFAAASAGDTIYFPYPSGSGYRVSGQLDDFPDNCNLQMDGRILYDGPKTAPVLRLGSTSADTLMRRHRIRVTRRDTATALTDPEWLSETYIGVRIINHHNSTIELDQIGSFPIGAQIIGLTRGNADLKIFCNRFTDNRIGLDIGGRGSLGWMNGCSVYGGWFQQGAPNSGPPTSVDCYSVRHWVEDATKESLGIWLFNPIAETTSGGGTGSRIGFFVPDSGSHRVGHHVVGCHPEGHTLLARVLRTGRCTYRTSYGSVTNPIRPIDHGAHRSHSTAFYENMPGEVAFSGNYPTVAPNPPAISSWQMVAALANQQTLRYTGTGGHTVTLPYLPPGGGPVRLINDGSGAPLIIAKDANLTTLLGAISLPAGRSATITWFDYGNVAEVSSQQQITFA
jgi:hypothetical protein